MLQLTCGIQINENIKMVSVRLSTQSQRSSLKYDATPLPNIPAMKLIK